MTDTARLKRDAARFAKGEPNVQHQSATMDQLRDLVVVANGMGMYDAADHIRRTYLVSYHGGNPDVATIDLY